MTDDARAGRWTTAPRTTASSRTAGRRPRTTRVPADRARPTPGDADAARRSIDRLGGLLERCDLTELEVESGGTGARPPQAGERRRPVGGAGTPGAQPARRHRAGGEAAGAGAAHEPAVASVPSVKAPLTGIFYASPAPGSAPYVQVGGEVAVGQVIGLIEAMKLFNEIKSDLAGRVVRVVPESGALVKAKQPLIEVEPL